MRHQMITWPMTSRDLKRSRSWPRYIWSQISRKRLEIGTWFQWSTNRKLHMKNRIVMWPVTSRDLERSKSWPQYVQGPISRKRLEIESVTMEHPNKCYMGVSNGLMLDDVTWLQKVKVVTQIYFSRITF